MESVKDSHQVSFLKTLLSQSCISLYISGIKQPDTQDVYANALHCCSLGQFSFIASLYSREIKG